MSVRATNAPSSLSFKVSLTGTAGTEAPCSRAAARHAAIKSTDTSGREIIRPNPLQWRLVTSISNRSGTYTARDVGLRVLLYAVLTVAALLLLLVVAVFELDTAATRELRLFPELQLLRHRLYQPAREFVVRGASL